MRRYVNIRQDRVRRRHRRRVIIRLIHLSCSTKGARLFIFVNLAFVEEGLIQIVILLVSINLIPQLLAVLLIVGDGYLLILGDATHRAE